MKQIRAALKPRMRALDLDQIASDAYLRYRVELIGHAASSLQRHMTGKDRQNHPGIEDLAGTILEQYLAERGDIELKAIKSFAKNKQLDISLTVPKRNVK
jgi:hypothetical protein